MREHFRKPPVVDLFVAYFKTRNMQIASCSQAKFIPRQPFGILQRLPDRIGSLRSLENLIFSLDSLQSWAVRASKKKYVSVVSREIAYRSQTGKPGSRVSQPVCAQSPIFTGSKLERRARRARSTLRQRIMGVFCRDKASN